MRLTLLAKICLITSLLGLVLLLIISKNGSTTESLLSLEEGQDVMLQGEVQSIQVFDNTATLEIRHDAYTKVIIFDNISDAPLRKGDLVRVFGKPSSQGSEKEIIADRIEQKKQS